MLLQQALIDRHKHQSELLKMCRFHVANPMNPMATDNPQRDVIDAAIAGDVPACIEMLGGRTTKLTLCF